MASMESASTPEVLESIYQRRFGADVGFRQRMWRILCKHFFQQYVPESASVLEVGAGYCEFINNIKAARKVAVDLNPDVARYANPDVQAIETSSTVMSMIPTGSIDIVFTSNFFEHITREDILKTMHEVARVLHPEGRFLILQPNIRFCARDFWMFFDHITPLDHHSLTEALEMCGFRTIKTIVRFLPFTTKSKLPKSPRMVWLYLKIPLLWRFLGQQTFVVAELNHAGVASATCKPE